MCLIFCLSVILTDFRPLFKYQNFHLFCVFVVGLIKQRGYLPYCGSIDISLLMKIKKTVR